MVATLCYVNAIRGDFVFDDIKLIVNNDVVKNATNIPGILFSNLWDLLGRGSNYYRPVPPLLFMAVHAVFGLRPEAFHLLNIAFHAGATGLVFLLARRLIPSPTSGPTRIWPATAAALLFATHPIHTEAVAWISGVMDVACTFFALLALYTYIVSDGGERKRFLYITSLVALFLALLSKEPAAMVPLLIIAYDLLFRRERIVNLRVATRRWAGVLGILFVYVTLRFIALGGLAPFRHEESSDALGVARTFPALFARYLEKLVVPVNLNVVHDIQSVASIMSVDFVWALAIIVASIALGVAAFRAGCHFRFGLLLLVLPLVPALYVPGLSQDLSKAFAERYLYFPSVGLSVLVGALVARVAERDRRWCAFTLTAMFAIALVFCGMTLSRNLVWRDSYALWSDCVRKSPNLAVAHENLGLALLRRGRVDEGRRELRLAVRLEPKLAEKSLESGILAARKGLFLQAVLALQTATTYRPDMVDAHYNLAVVFENKGWVDAAIGEYVQVLALRPDHADAHNNLGVLLAQRGRLDDAIVHFEAAVRGRPDDRQLQLNLEHARDLAAGGGQAESVQLPVRHPQTQSH